MRQAWNTATSATKVELDSLLQLGDRTYEARRSLRGEYFSQNGLYMILADQFSEIRSRPARPGATALEGIKCMWAMC